MKGKFLLSTPAAGFPIHWAVASHAASHPYATALISAGQRISYGILDAAADGYAAELAKRGAGAGKVVPILLPRSPQLIALKLGILKCGAAYTNLDPKWPADRLEAILEQISPPVVVAESAINLGRSAVYQPPGESLDSVAARAGAFVPVMVDSATAPAVVFFTSGTTGKPKGIIASHRAVTRLFRPAGLEGFGPGHVMPQAAALQWDMHAFELWGQLTSGGTSVLIEGDYLLPDTLRELVQTAGVDVMWLTTSLFNLFVDEDPECFEGMDRVFVGGEALSPAHIRTFLEYHPGIALKNGYGPAENCMLTSIHDIGIKDCDAAGGIPIGLPVRATQVVLLDAGGQSCAVGQPGEICATGDGLALGYLGDTQLTREKFPCIVIGGKPQRIYRTGDMGLIDDSGIMHFRGRCDRQVKVRGHRIELAELEVTTRALQGVRDCAAVPIPSIDGRVGKIGLVYLTRKLLGTIGADRYEDPLAVRQQLLEKLPAYAVPAIVRCVERFPVTANGKLDRNALEKSLADVG